MNAPLKLPPAADRIIRRLITGLTAVGQSRRIGEYGQAFEPISVEIIGKGIVSVAQTYICEGDVMWDPMCELYVTDAGIWPLYFEQSLPFVMRRVAKVEGEKLVVLDERHYRDLVAFCLEWATNLDSQHDF